MIVYIYYAVIIMGLHTLYISSVSYITGNITLRDALQGSCKEAAKPRCEDNATPPSNRLAVRRLQNLRPTVPQLRARLQACAWWVQGCRRAGDERSRVGDGRRRERRGGGREMRGGERGEEAREERRRGTCEIAQNNVVVRR